MHAHVQLHVHMHFSMYVHSRTAKYTHEGEEGADRVEGLGGDEL